MREARIGANPLNGKHADHAGVAVPAPAIDAIEQNTFRAHRKERGVARVLLVLVSHGRGGEGLTVRLYRGLLLSPGKVVAQGADGEEIETVAIMRKAPAGVGHLSGGRIRISQACVEAPAPAIKVIDQRVFRTRLWERDVVRALPVLVSCCGENKGLTIHLRRTVIRLPVVNGEAKMLIHTDINSGKEKDPRVMKAEEALDDLTTRKGELTQDEF